MGASRKSTSTGLVQSMRKLKEAFVAMALGAMVLLAGCSASDWPAASTESQVDKEEPNSQERPETSQEKAIKRYNVYKFKKQKQEEAERREQIEKQKEKEKRQELQRQQRENPGWQRPINILGT